MFTSEVFKDLAVCDVVRFTVQLNDLLKVAEDVFDVRRRQDGISDQRLVKQILQNLHHSNMCSFCVEQLCESNDVEEKIKNKN